MKYRCNHCHLEFDEEIFIVEQNGEDSLRFCCNGCQGVYHLLKSEGLDSFYDKLGSSTIEPPILRDSELSKFDTQSYYNKYVKYDDDGYAKISLIIEGIHCAACVWLNEKILHRCDGVIEASLNYTNNRAYITWDDKKIKLSEIIKKIRSIGYDAYAYDRSLQEERSQKIRKEYYTKMIVGIFCTMNIMWIAVAQYAGYFSGMHPEVKAILDFASFVLTTPTIFYSGSIFFKNAYAGLRNRMINMDFLVISGALLIYFYSIYAGITQRGETYFESATMIVTFILVGKFLEVLGRKSAGDTLDKLNAQIPTQVRVYRENTLELITPEEVKKGDVIELVAGDKAAIDGVLLSSLATFDESLISGESAHISKQKGDKIFSGSINIDGSIKYLASLEFEHSLLNRLVSLVEDALKSKPKIETRANEISSIFSVAILSISSITFFIWYYLNGDFEHSMIVAISVLIIACPCALALATPVATLVGVSSALKKGVLFKEARFLESVAKAKILLLDKTGTITHGRPKVVESRFDFSYSNLLRSLLASSKHPISKGVLESIESLELATSNREELLELNEIKEIRSQGVRALYGDKELLGGSAEFLKSKGVASIPNLGIGSEFFFSYDGELIGSFLLKDEIKSDAKSAIDRAKRAGFEVVMISGDNEMIAKEVAKSVDIEKVHFKCTPEQKAEILGEYQKDGLVVMVGDGINDAIALSKSDVSIAMGEGSDVATSVSDIVILNDRLDSVAFALEIGKRSYSFIKQNLAISLVYNALTIPIAMMGYVIPLIAALSMSLSSLLVVGNSLRISKDR